MAKSSVGKPKRAVKQNPPINTWPGHLCAAVLVVVAAYGFAVQEPGGGTILSHNVDVSWNESRSPLLVAASIFGSQSLVSIVLVAVLSNMRELSDCWGSRFQSSLRLYATMSLVGAFMYFSKYCSQCHFLVHVHGVGEYFLTRSLHWLVSTPTQWFVFSQVCSKAKAEEMMPIYFATVSCQVWGIVMLFMKQASLRWFFFWVSGFYFVHMFWLVFKLQLLKDMKDVGHQLRLMSLVIWTGFPLCVFGRWTGVVSTWAEQVLFFSIFDVCAKSITFSAIIMSRVVLSLARINGTVQLVLASQDVTLAVDENWQLLDSPESLGLISSYFCDGSDNMRLHNLCINEEHSLRLFEAARQADSQHLSAPTPKVIVALRMPTGGGEMLVECLVSKCLHGRRIIGMAVASQSGMPGPSQLVDGEVFEDDGQLSDPSNSVLSMRRADPLLDGNGHRNVEAQMALALHNCNDVLQFSEHLRRMVNALFLQSHTACGLIVWEEGETDMGVSPTIVVASPRLQALFFQNSPMPQPLDSLTVEDQVETVLMAMQMQETIMHQWRTLEARNGLTFEMTVLPLNRMSSVAANSRVQLSIIIVQLVPSGNNGQGYFRWIAQAGKPVCTGPSAVPGPSPPQILAPLVAVSCGCAP